MKKRLSSITATVAALALLLTTPVAANASPPRDSSEHANSPPAASAAAAPYSDEEIVGLFVFGAGRAAEEHPPDIVAAYVADPLPSTSLEVVADLTAQLLAVNPRFHQEVTIPVQTNKPSQVLKAQDAFNAALRAILQTGPIDDGVSTQCALWVAAAGAVVVVVAVAGGIAVQTLVAVNYNWVWAYVQPGGDSGEFTAQKQAAEIAANL